MHVVIIGTGAVGGYIGAALQEQLTASGIDEKVASVRMVARPDTAARLRKEGISISDERGTRQVYLSVVTSLFEIKTADVVVLATKTINSTNLPDQLPAGAVLVTTQNSVEMPTLAVEKYGKEKVLPGVVRGFFIRTGITSVRLAGTLKRLDIGSLATGTESTAERFASLLNAAGIDSRVDEKIMSDIWAKAMFVTTFGALGALVNQPLGVVRTVYRDNLRDLILEIYAVAQASGVQLPDDIVEQTIELLDKQAESSTSSLQRDLSAGLPSELDAQVGAVIRMAQRAQVSVPLHLLLRNVLEPTNRGSGSANMQQ
ncbi:2-dehydropantoate 2-reductase [Corynebacterium kutscheri]|uniref:2-dehydropantoate 2-reductase n=1 Tax=Corynebacterium kutscheri TaxID=35755 RepID=A0A0F6R0H4_9CORY|nr:2-dehydropantoate 2-reductase [Corynebacterium kutscheri]AKE41742.1 2-dehydropantoate 2-reductase [Corynebacterium kutscheri]VEH10068.1 2-dehydropantoate 2-reductase [Corynebacterium kutscheri]